MSIETTVTADFLQKKYETFVTQNKARPQTVRQFATAFDIGEKDFYLNYTGFNEVETDLFKSYFANAVQILQKDGNFTKFDSAEKLLAFYYTWFELLKPHREFILHIEEKKNLWIKTMEFFPIKGNFLRFLAKQSYILPTSMAQIRPHFLDFVNPILQEGMKEDLAERMWVSNKYNDIIWGQTVLLYRFWLDDTSEDQINTDAAIEKSTSFLFHLLRPNAWDTGLDLAKFLFQKATS